MGLIDAASVIEALEAFEPQYLPWLDRRDAIAVLKDGALPRPNSEAWKYTDPVPFFEFNNDSPDGHNTATIPTVPSRLVGFESDAVRTLVTSHINQAVDQRRYPLAAISYLKMDRGLVIHVKQGDAAETIELGELDGHFQRILVIVETEARLELIETTTGSNRVVECFVAPGAELRHRRLQASGTGIDYNLVAINISENGSYIFSQYSAGAHLRRNDISVNILGTGANAELTGAWQLNEALHLDNQISVNHLVGGGTSRQHFRGNVGDSAKSIFNGRIYIAADAQKTNATLTNRNLVTSPKAEVYTKPELEIYANDVICSHGATVGQLDAAVLFYFQSRGIGEDEARAILIRGFLNEVVAHDDGRAVLGIEVRNHEI